MFPFCQAGNSIFDVLSSSGRYLWQGGGAVVGSLYAQQHRCIQQMHSETTPHADTAIKSSCRAESDSIFLGGG